jgi:hypothetical protein
MEEETADVEAHPADLAADVIAARLGIVVQKEDPLAAIGEQMRRDEAGYACAKNNRIEPGIRTVLLQDGIPEGAWRRGSMRKLEYMKLTEKIVLKNSCQRAMI